MNNNPINKQKNEHKNESNNRYDAKNEKENRRENIYKKIKFENIKILQGIIHLDDVQAFLKRWDNVVFLNAEYIVDENHAYFAAEKAIKAWNEKKSIAKSLLMEIILYASATRQINKAITLGLKEGTNKVVAVLLDKEKIKSIKEVLKPSNVLYLNEDKVDKIISFFNITKEEFNVCGIEKLNLLVRERIVLFDIYKR